ncbi:transporter substrate-binding domain-containing protein [soil metagenome]
MIKRYFFHFYATLAILLGMLHTGHAGPVQVRVLAAGTVRVCIWPDYFGITYRHPHTGVLSGLDIDLSAELARDLGVKLVYVDSSFQTLVADLLADRCDVAMFAVGKLKQRMEVLRFTRAYMASDIYGITVKGSRIIHEWADIDKPGVLVGVQAGTFMEAVMGERLKQARMVLVKPPVTRERELQAGRVDVFMTDFPYSHGLVENADWAARIAPPQPFFVLPYAYAVKPGDDEWLKVVDQFVERIMKDGRLDAAGRRSGLTPIIVH